MSLLTDHDFLLHTLHLSYLRHVLPSHAPNSALAGHSPYNLLSFPPSALAAPDSAYLALSPRLREEERFPELRSGRGSPPLALQLARGGAEDDAGAGAGVGSAGTGVRRRRGGPGGLQYAQTIGKGGEGAGAAAAASLGRGKGRRGRLSGNGGEGETSPQRDRRAVEEDGQGASAEGFDRRHPQDAFLTTQRLSQPSLAPPTSTDPSSQPHPNAHRPLPPELVIHSPVRTPAHSPPVSPSISTAAAGAMQPFQPFHQAAEGATAAKGTAPEPTGEDLSGSPSSPVPHASLPAGASPPTRRQRFADEPPSVAPSSPASLSDFPTRPPVAVSPSSLSSSSSASPFPSPSPLATPAAEADDSDVSSSFTAPNAGAAGAAGSMASSGVSLFGTSRLTGARLGPIGEGDDSEASDFLAAPPPPPPPPPRASEPPSPPSPPALPEPEQQQQQQQQPVVPAFQLPPGLRVRERRRVNLRPGIGILIPSSLAAPPPPAAEPAPAPASQPEPSPPPPARAPAGSPAPPAAAAAPPPQPDSLAPPLRSSSSRPSSPTPIFFPPRAVYIRQAQQKKPSSPPLASAPTPRSGLSALLAPAPASSSLSTGEGTATPGGTSRENPFARLYSSLISRTAAPPPPPAPATNRRRRGPPPPPPAPDAPLLLTLWFPHSTSSSSGGSEGGGGKGLKVLLKNPRTLAGGISVEEVIGAGLYSYVEAGARPPLDEGLGEGEREEWARRARNGEETARWSLRIVEEGEEGEVDEDFPPLDRTRNISAFAFTEFAIVKAEGEQQISDNLAKQATLTRRPSRILSNPVPSLPSAVAPASSAPSANGEKPNAEPKKQEIKLKVHIPPTVAGDAAPSSVDVAVTASTALSTVLDLALRACSPPPSLIPPRPGQPPSPAPPSALDPAAFALLLRLSDSDLVLPLDRTVGAAGLTSLAAAEAGKKAGAVGSKEVWVVPKSVLGGVGLGLGPRMGAALVGRRSVSGGKREGEAVGGEGGGGGFFPPPSPHLASSAEAAAQQAAAEQQEQQRLASAAAAAGPPYLHYNVLRKLPMSLGGRHPRTIAIDGDYLHFMPPDPRFFGAHAAHGLPLDGAHHAASTSGRTTSLHISSVHSCKVSRRSASSFKIVVHTPRNIDKRYDFEAESPEVAAEIVERVKGVMRVYGAERGRSGQAGRLVKGGGRG
ncbi:hypothetical protein JCM6882_000546 [Rhodosporidiobolus microsporus]